MFIRYNLTSTSQIVAMTAHTSASHNQDQPSSQVSLLERFQVWKLEDAKAKFSEVVRLARDTNPQRITVRGEDAVVILSAQEFAKLLPLIEQPSLHALLSQSPLSQLQFEQPSEHASVRDVEL